jgi:K(+)-stimulated pyrophosphate-energized sodium pump
MSTTVETILLYTIAAGFLSIVYGFFTGKNILNQSAGNAKMQDIASAIQIGAKAYLARQYKTIAIVGVVVLVIVSIAFSPLVGLGYLIGATLSGIAGYVGMLVSVEANVRTAEASRKGLAQGLSVAFKSGAVTGMLVAGLALLSIAVYYFFLLKYNVDEREIVNALVALGFGASLISIFARLGGGIFTKGADVGADLVGKVEAGIPEDDPRNPAVIADNVGDNVGDIAGMGADLFGSLAEATCAALVIAASASALTENTSALYYPILISAIGIPVALFCTAFLSTVPDDSKNIEPVLKRLLLISTLLMTVAITIITNLTMVDSFQLGDLVVTRSAVLISVLTGLWAGLIIGYVTEYYTSHTYQPVRDVAEASKTGAATNIIYGLSLGYKSTVIPTIAIALTVYISWHFAGMYGIALAAIGMISTIAVGLTIDAYGPVSDNAGGISEMCELEDVVRERTDILDAAGNTTAAIGKGFAIGSAVLTALALFAAFLTRSEIETLNLLNPAVFAGLLVGGVLPCLFTAQTMRAVGTAAFAMIEEVRHQFKTIPGIMEGTGRPDYKRCVEISTESALKQMVAPAILVIVTPIAFGSVFGVEALAGLLAGSLVVGVVTAISASNSGGAWDNAKKYIEAGACGGKGSDSHKAAVVGDTVGDPYKDTSGPSLNILMKLMAILSLVFAPFMISAHQWILGFFG